MSWGAWGSGPEPFDIEQLYRHGWVSDGDCQRWWRGDDPDKTYTLDEAIAAYEDWQASED